MSGALLFSTYFPHLDELKLVFSAGISTVYFFGEVNDPESAKFLNTMTREGSPLEMVKLEI